MKTTINDEAHTQENKDISGGDSHMTCSKLDADYNSEVALTTLLSAKRQLRTGISAWCQKENPFWCCCRKPLIALMKIVLMSSVLNSFRAPRQSAERSTIHSNYSWSEHHGTAPRKR